MRFRYAHAAHPDWTVAVEECLLLLAQQSGAAGFVREPNLGFVYITDTLARYADGILSMLKARTGISSWVGASAAGVCATGVEYTEEPALVVMLGQFSAGTFNVFSGTQRPPALSARTATGAQAAWTALVHADPQTPDVPAMLQDMSHKLASGQLFGGVASGRHAPVQIADQLLSGGLSGVVFSEEVTLATALTQGCFPLRGASPHTVTAVQAQQLLALDHQRAFDVLVADAGLAPKPYASNTENHAIDLSLRHALHALARQGLFVGVEGKEESESPSRRAYVVRNILALDPGSGAVTSTVDLHVGQRITFCTRDETAARKDLVRICAEMRDEIFDSATGARTVQGAVYISCVARGGHLFGEQGEELRLIQSHLGSVPLVGFYGNGEINGRQLHGYSGVLVVFLSADSKTN